MKPTTRIALRRCINTGRVLFLVSIFLASQSFAAHLVVDTIEDLRDTTPTSSSDTVQVLDYYSGTTPTRGRSGGLFRAVSTNSVPRSADDGGKYIAPDSNVANIWERVFNGEVPNVKMWGAVGNGTANDTVAIQKAVNAVRENRVGGGG